MKPQPPRENHQTAPQLGFTARAANALAQVGVRSPDNFHAPDLLHRLSRLPPCAVLVIDEVRRTRQERSWRIIAGTLEGAASPKRQSAVVEPDRGLGGNAVAEFGAP